MLSIEEAIQVIKDKNKKSDALVRCARAYYEMSLHIDGACPSYIDANGGVIYPTNYFGDEYQRIFEESLFTKYPYQSEETRQYQLSQYRPYQKESFLRAIQVIVGAIFQDGNYNVIVSDKDDNTYIWGNNFDGTDLCSYYQNRFIDTCVDANGYFVVIPNKSRFETGTMVEPVIWFVRCVDILHISDDEIIFVKDNTYWLINRVAYFRFKKEFDVIVNIDEDGYFAHLLGYLPIIRGGGVRNTQGFYESWLYAAKPIADEYVGEKSLASFVNKQNAHPFYISADEECPSCINGEYQWCTNCNVKTNDCVCNDPANWKLSTCTSCGGTGVRAHDPSKWMIVPKEDMKNDQIKIVSADTNIVKVQFDNVKDVDMRIMRALHLTYIEAAQSGEAKARDMETRYQFISMICNYIFDTIIYQSVAIITSLRHVTVSGGRPTPKVGVFSIVKPTSFNIMTDEEIIGGINDKSPDFVKARQMEDYVDKKFGGDDVFKKKTSLVLQLDKLALSNNDTIQTLLLNGGITRRDLMFHVELPYIIDQIERERGGDYMVKATFDAIKQEVIRLFDILNPPQPQLITNVIDNL